MPATSSNYLQLSWPGVYDVASRAEQFSRDSIDALMALKEFDCECEEQRFSTGGLRKYYTEAEFRIVTEGLTAAILFVKEYKLDSECSQKPFFGRAKFFGSLSKFGLVDAGEVDLALDNVDRRGTNQDARAFEDSLRRMSEGLKPLFESTSAQDVTDAEQEELKARSGLMKRRYEKLEFFRWGRAEFSQAFLKAISRKDLAEYGFNLVEKASADTSVVDSATVLGSNTGATSITEAREISQSTSRGEALEALSLADAETVSFTPRFAVALAQGHVPEDLRLPLQVLCTQTSVADCDNPKGAALRSASPGFRAAQGHLAKVLECPPVAQRLTAQDMLELMRDLMLEPTPECSLSDWKEKIGYMVYTNPHRLGRIGAAEPKSKLKRKGHSQRKHQAEELPRETALWWAKRERLYWEDIRPRVFKGLSHSPQSSLFSANERDSSLPIAVTAHEASIAEVISHGATLAASSSTGYMAEDRLVRFAPCASVAIFYSDPSDDNSGTERASRASADHTDSMRAWVDGFGPTI